ncbi:MAG: biotin/lipoate A/B protein ligase family protein [Pirellulales bacterium]
MPNLRDEAASTPCRLIIESGGAGAHHMAVDEVLLESAAASGAASLRFYRWSEPTISLGYFQSLAQRAEHPASVACPLVRRQTGGGAILHDHELTYSLAVPSTHPLAANSLRLYAAVHDCLVGILAITGYVATRWPAGEKIAAPRREPFLCFQRRAPGDVLCQEVKICGSAQRRRRGAILQHGSLLLARSAFAPELPGLAELGAAHLQNTDPLAQDWSQALAGMMALQLQAGGLTPLEQQAAARLEREKYGDSSWSARR